jgi:prepilin-type N-terminal cleavage/methylation domain-containing protein
MNFDIRGLAERGFTLMEIMIVVAICALLAAVAVPAYSKARSNAQRKACIINLRQIDGAKQVWAIERKKSQGSTARRADIVPYLSQQRMPTCPARGIYSVRPVGRDPTCTRVQIGHALSNLNMDEDPEPD